MPDFEALKVILTDPGAQIVLLALIGLLLIWTAVLLLVLSSDKLTANLAYVLRGFRGKK